MPFVEIPPEMLQHLSLFGSDLLHDDDQYAWYSSSRGRMRVDKSKPIVWVDDVEDAMQLKAVAVMKPVRPT